MRASTIREYLEAVNSLFVAKQCTPPINFKNPSKNSPAMFYEQIKTWKEEPTRRTHMTSEFLHALFIRADHTVDKDSFVLVVMDWTIMA